MLGGIKNMYFYKLLVFLHIFIFAFIFLFYFYFLLFVARYGTVNTRFSLLPSDFYDFLFAPHRLLTTVPHSFQSIVVHRLLPRCCCCSCCCCWDFPVCFCCLQTERCLRRQSVGGHVRNYTEKCFQIPLVGTLSVSLSLHIFFSLYLFFLSKFLQSSNLQSRSQKTSWNCLNLMKFPQTSSVRAIK